MKKFLIIGAPRSGTTSFSNIINLFPNYNCNIEPDISIHKLLYQKYCSRRVISNEVVNETLKNNLFKRFNINKLINYGEKDVIYGPFIKNINEYKDLLFIFIYRDGRDVVSSLMNWHLHKFGNIYRENLEIENISIKALENLGTNLLLDDYNDLSRFRPDEKKISYLEWQKYSRFEKCIQYWSHLNNTILNNLKNINSSNYRLINYTDPSIEDLYSSFELLGIRYKKSTRKIKTILSKKVNSLEDRDGISNKIFPNWHNWTSKQRDQFDKHAYSVMKKFNLIASKPTRWRPSNYGSFWINKKIDIDFYIWMFNSRSIIHNNFFNWFNLHKKHINSILEYGSGISYIYNDFFKDKKYTAIDISKASIDWCNKNYSNYRHKYICKDFIEYRGSQKNDLVFSSGTIDNVYDIDEFIISMIKNSSKFIYITFYRGWFPDIDEHFYFYNNEHNCFYNNISIKRVKKILHLNGWKLISANPLITNNDEIIYETEIIAQKNI